MTNYNTTFNSSTAQTYVYMGSVSNPLLGQYFG